MGCNTYRISVQLAALEKIWSRAERKNPMKKILPIAGVEIFSLALLMIGFLIMAISPLSPGVRFLPDGSVTTDYGIRAWAGIFWSMAFWIFGNLLCLASYFVYKVYKVSRSYFNVLKT